MHKIIKSLLLEHTNLENNTQNGIKNFYKRLTAYSGRYPTA